MALFGKMTDLLLFYPQGKYLHIEFLATKYLARQPKTPAQKEMFILSVKPIIAQLDDYVTKHKLKEIIELNLKGVSLSSFDASVAIDLIHMCMEIRPDKGLLEKIVITNTNPVFNMIYKTVKGKLPRHMCDLLEIAADSKFF